MKKLTKAQNELLQSIKSGDKVQGWQARNRFTMNAGTNRAKVIRKQTIMPLLESDLLTISFDGVSETYKV